MQKENQGQKWKTLYIPSGIKSITFLQGSQAMTTRPNERNNVIVKKLV
jgi:hypothetical protein